MSASLARTVFRPAPASSPLTSSAASQCPARHIFPHATRSSGQTQQRNVNLMAHLAVLATLLASTQYYLSHPDALMFDHPPRSAIGWVPAKHIAHRQLLASASSPSSAASLPPRAAYTSNRVNSAPLPAARENATALTTALSSSYDLRKLAMAFLKGSEP
ncbi:uncharacterized protein JCM15063_001966 [Sporobolomyces koalae]|uniref:uncharacterized protein n=1 Tax=Sporobolomyces koalae TaxID=500713 RepID=UPI00317AB630